MTWLSNDDISVFLELCVSMISNTFSSQGVLRLKVYSSPFEWTSSAFSRFTGVSLFSIQVYYPFMTLGSRWALWKTEWQGSTPSAALSSLLDWNFLAVEETHVLETKGQNLGMKSDFERSEAN